MVKQLQLYTIIIVIIVIVLSQFSFQDEASISTEKRNIENKTTINNNVLDSKYAEPIREVVGVIDNTKSSINKVKVEINKVKKFLDIEQNIKDLNNMMQ